jgi:hypothetical protein
MKARLFEPWEDEFLREVGDALSPGEIGKVIGRNKNSIRQRIIRLGIEVNQALLKGRIEASRIQKGNIPPLKGKKGHRQPPGCEKGWFKKGHVPHNANTGGDGELSLRADKRGIYNWHFRQSLGKWISFNRVVWEWYNGPIPPRHCIIHLDGNAMNCAPRNLACITKADNARRNSASINLHDTWVAGVMAGTRRKELRETILNHPDLIEVGRQSIILKRTIRNVNK